ncbi:ABC transporter ATP-binding protein/permease [Humitalea sp. 24SJ18S-53]|uniref:ABC transporter ATP-binding protein/permease n=1 Tax=Humitalea sp. 24SJ18S-53 TaxID=3422307 RepID=UPI003D6717AE
MRASTNWLADAFALARPYWSGDERWRARGLLAVVIALNLALVGMSVLLTFWQNAFYNALQNKDQDAFMGLLFLGRTTAEGTFPGFTVVAFAYIFIAVYGLYLRQALEIRWRRWLTHRLMEDWLGGRAHYRLSLTANGFDNPDQRIAEDSKLFVANTLTLGLGLMNAVVTLFSFIFVLWGLSGSIEVLGITIPGYMVWVALIYSLIGTWLAHIIGRPLIQLNYNQEKVEADFRYALVRVRDGSEGIALHGGEADERRGLEGRFDALRDNWWSIMTATKRLTFFTAGFGQVASIFPIVVAAPAYFAGAIQLGGLIQTSSAFGQVQGSLSWFVDSYSRLTDWRATVLRLSGFGRAIEAARAAEGGPDFVAGQTVGLHGLKLSLPDGRVLVEGAEASIAAGERVLLTGASGSGKSTLFRALAGIWPFGAGKIEHPITGRALFLPQRPYIPLGSLKRVVCYPDDAAAHADAEVAAALELVGLGALVPRLNEEDSWERRLSGGEQQRLAMARALLLKPEWLFLDEATASLDSEAEAMLYGLLRERLPKTAIISIAHRPAVAQYHERALRLAGGRLTEGPLPA